jgi:uncharacterized protein (TIGR00299 family) protein
MSYPSSAEALLPSPALPPPSSLAIHLDLVGGLSGDMFVAAMVDALPALAPMVLAEVDKVRGPDERAATFTEAANGGLRARRFGLVPEGDAGQARSSPRGRSHSHEHQHVAAHGTPYATLRRRIEAAPLSASTGKHALALLALLGDAEARVHGIPVDEVHFHELADWDSLLDVVAAGCIAGLLDGARWTATSLPLGSGTARTAHGVLPVPTPATTLLLTGYPWHDDGIGTERVTPTGGAILRHLVPAEQCNGRRDAGRLLRAGAGTGTRTLPGLPNIVRVLVTERTHVTDADIDIVSVLEFDVDDMTGEEIAVAADRLRTEAGVLDVSVATRHGKKGRPLAEFRLLARPEASDAIAQACFTETSTLGLRWREERRRVLRRVEVVATLDDVPVAVKVALRPGGKRTAKAAHDDVAKMRGLTTRRQRRAAAVKDALAKGDE